MTKTKLLLMYFISFIVSSLVSLGVLYFIDGVFNLRASFVTGLFATIALFAGINSRNTNKHAEGKGMM